MDWRWRAQAGASRALADDGVTVAVTDGGERPRIGACDEFAGWSSDAVALRGYDSILLGMSMSLSYHIIS